jgi:hypothetical protein
VYVPRGTKSVRKLIDLAERSGAGTVLVICGSGDPEELRFLERCDGWRWSELNPRLRRVILARDRGVRCGRRVAGVLGAGDARIARMVSRVFALPLLSDPRLPAVRVDENSIGFFEGDVPIGPLMEVERWSRG